MHHSCQTAASFLSFTFEFRGAELEIKYFCQPTGRLLISICIMVHWLNFANREGKVNRSYKAAGCFLISPNVFAASLFLQLLLQSCWMLS